jgi:DNA polymerase (family X)
MLSRWMADAPQRAEPSPVRRGFLTRAECDRILAANAGRAVRGDLQVHTLGSDGADSIRDIAEAARARGLRYLAITDHSRGLAIAHGMSDERLARQGEDIRGLNEQYANSGFRILRGVEMNLSPRGEGDLDSQFLGHLDLVLGAFHSRLRLTDDQRWLLRPVGGVRLAIREWLLRSGVRVRHRGARRRRSADLS